MNCSKRSPMLLRRPSVVSLERSSSQRSRWALSSRRPKLVLLPLSSPLVIFNAMLLTKLNVLMSRLQAEVKTLLVLSSQFSHSKVKKSLVKVLPWWVLSVVVKLFSAQENLSLDSWKFWSILLLFKLNSWLWIMLWRLPTEEWMPWSSSRSQELPALSPGLSLN